MIRCGFCGHEYTEEEGIKGCGKCGKPCRSIRCPKCFYENPVEPAMVKKLKKVFGRTS
ncbi:hypothetical protein [Geobacter sp. AOG1]|uniref:hypothetical protein n=1 Tax=Geobacter sp. AOG1 TaxID=1566346 RepID=UPI001CC5832E|nr:hypothetical protein [Geobacter sp. AOG1]GFE59401.1 hypothetical protein AOG1_32810 [Geobacter sp. AOG1]